MLKIGSQKTQFGYKILSDVYQLLHLCLINEKIFQ